MSTVKIKAIDELIQMVLPIGMMNIDQTHIRLLNSILTVGQFNHALEIGSFDGASAVAFIAAINDESLKRVDFCDPNFQPRFYDVLQMCSRQNDVTLHYCPSNQAICPKYDCVFVDGDHRLEIVSEEARMLIESNIQTVIAHDTNASNVGFRMCEGAGYLMQHLVENGYSVIQDCIDRPGERTDRGFMFATKDTTLFESVRPLFQCLQ
tara:strand:- start:656 stop:1279 length:624 start_codon:yes stop_codon:yes gene_type:complete